MPPEKPKKKKRPIEDLSSSEEKPKKKKRPKGESSKPKKKVKKKVQSKKSVKTNLPIKKLLIGVLVIIASIYAFKGIQQSSKDKTTAKGYALALSALDKMQLRCTVLWSEIGIDKVCSQSLGEMAIGKLKKDVELTVIEGRSHRFTARAKAKEAGSDKVFQVNKKGKLFLNVNDCLAEVKVLNPTIKMIKRLESKCRSKVS